jgi:8-oxo-dGTP diphosphatase
MMNDTIYDIVENITPYDNMEREHKENVLQWIRSGAELCRLEKPATPPKHLVSYFIPIDCKRNKMLLVDHKKALLWLPPGGHVEQGEHPTDTAHRELQEELFVSLPLLQPDPLFVTVTETVGTTAGHIDVSLWYVYDADSTVTFDYDEKEFNGISWFSTSELPLEHSDPHTGRFHDKLISTILYKDEI